MKILLHRLIHNAIAPAKPQHPLSSPEQIVGLNQAHFEDELTLHHLAAKTTGKPALALLKSPAALKLGNLLLPINKDMTIERGFAGRERTEIRSFGSDITIDRPQNTPDTRYRVWGPNLDVEEGPSTLLSAYHSGEGVAVRSLGQEVRVSRLGNHLSIDKPGRDQDVNIQRNRDGYALNFWDSRKNMDIQFKGGETHIRQWNGTTTLTEKNNKIEIDRPGWDRDLTLEQRPGKIEVDGRGFDQDFDVTYSAHKIALDKRGFDDDITITHRGNTVKIDRRGLDQDLEIEIKNGYIELDRIGMDQDVTVKGTAGRFTLQEGGMTISVTPSGLRLLSVQVDEDFDVAI